MLLYICLTIILISCIFVLYSYKKNTHTLFLAAYFCILANYGMTHYFTTTLQSDFWLAIFYNHFSPLWVLVGPFLFFYVRGTVEDKTGIRKMDWIHFIPFLTYLITTGPYYIKPFSEKLEIARLIHENLDNLKVIKGNLIFNATINFILRPTLLLIYIIASLSILYKYYIHKKQSTNIPVQQRRVTYRWLFLICLSSFMLVASFLKLTYNYTQVNISYQKLGNEPFHLMSGIFFLILTISPFFFPQILYGLPTYSKLQLSKTSNPEPVALEVNSDETQNEEENQEMIEEPFNQLAEKIMEFLHTKKPYLQQDFSVHDLAIAMDAPNHHISYCLNRVLKTNFANLKNKLRVDYAKELLNSNQASKMSIEGIGQMAGFGTRSNFYSAFKKETGITPSEYIQNKETTAS